MWPFLTTTSQRLAPTQYGISVTFAARQTTISACLPTSSDPACSATPTAWAALMVVATSVSAGVSFISRQATVMTSGRFGVGEVPGLKSVPRATGTPASMNRRAGAASSAMRNQVVAGSSVATVGWSPPAA